MSKIENLYEEKRFFHKFILLVINKKSIMKAGTSLLLRDKDMGGERNDIL